MKVGIIGSGGREHAICAALKKSSKINKIFCFPGNAGTTLIAENVDLDTNDFQKLSEFIIENKIDIVNFLKSNSYKIYNIKDLDNEFNFEENKIENVINLYAKL